MARRPLLAAVAALLLLAARPARAERTEFEYQLDAYYTAADFYVYLTSAPIKYFEFKNEADLYKTLLLSSPVPRFLLLEASVNPLPCAGVLVKRRARGFYDDAQVSSDLNLVRSVTTGFEEPAALSAFLGNIIDFKPVKKKSYAEGRGYTGWLASAGNYHIKDNALYKDDWIETEWKIKGDRVYPDLKLQWSFRLGAKFHANREIADIFYVGLRRSRTDYKARGFSWWRNSGATYRFDFSQRNGAPIQHRFAVDKKFPREGRKWVPVLVVGFQARARDKYTGSLRDADPKEFEFIFQPNVEF